MNTILAWIINDYHEQGNTIITILLLSLGHISNTPPPSFSLLFPPSRILFQLGKGGILLPEGVGLLLARPILAGHTPPPLILYIRGQGAPLDTQVDPRDHILSRVRRPLPP